MIGQRQPVQRAFTRRLVGMPYDSEPLSASEPIAAPDPDPVPAPEPAKTSINTGDCALPKNKGGRPRKYPVGTSAATRMRNVRREQEQAAKEQARTEEIAALAKEQNTEDKDTSGQVRGPGKYMPGAEKGKGELLNVNNLERTEGWSQLNDLYGSAAALDAATAEEFEAKLSEAFSKNPDLAACFGDISLDEIHTMLRKYMTTGLKHETGSKGEVTAQGVSIQINDTAQADECPTRYVVKLTDGECAEINACLRKLRDDEEYCQWVKYEDNKDGGESGYHKCQLCGRNLGTMSAWLIGQHFVQEHTKAARRFFREQRVPFRAGYLGVLNGKEKRKSDAH